MSTDATGRPKQIAYAGSVLSWNSHYCYYTRQICWLVKFTKVGVSTIASMPCSIYSTFSQYHKRVSILVTFGQTMLWWLRLSQPATAWQRGCKEMGRERGNGEEMEREISSLSTFSPSFHFLFFLLFPLISSQFTEFLASVAKILTWGNNSWSKQAARKPHNLCRPTVIQLQNKSPRMDVV